MIRMIPGVACVITAYAHINTPEVSIGHLGLYMIRLLLRRAIQK